MKHFISLVIAIILPIMAWAQYGVGEWRIHPCYVGTAVTNVVDAGDAVYYVSSQNLYRYDKQTQENESYNKLNYLSDVTVTGIYYNPDKEYLVVTYINSNIDIILKSGEVINMPEIKDAVMTSKKDINDVGFGKGKIYVSTYFGYITIDDTKWVVSESFNAGHAIGSMMEMGDYLVMYDWGVQAIYVGKTNEHHYGMGAFTRVMTNVDRSFFYPIDDTHFFWKTGWFFIGTISVDGSTVTVNSSETLAEAAPVNVQRTPSGYIANFLTEGYYLTFNAQGGGKAQVNGGNELYSSYPKGDGTLWAAGSNGLHQAGSESYYTPNGVTFANPFWLTYNEPLDLLYVSNSGPNHFTSAESKTGVSTYNGTTWTDVTPYINDYGTYRIIFDPEDPNTYFLSGWRAGLHKVTGTQNVYNYNSSNSPMKANWSMRPFTDIDRKGNLWVAQALENPETPVMVLPAAKRKLNTGITAADWYTPNVKECYVGGSRRANLIATKNTNKSLCVFAGGGYQFPFVIWDASDITNPSPTKRTFSSFIDQDEKPFSWTYTYAITEDLNGLVWVGFVEGIICFNPDEAFNSDFKINHVKVPRNDGTSLADYLLDGIQVNCIAVDGANRKWIGTNASGVYLVSPDGTEILKHFNTTNSPLASNIIYQICCNPNSNSVYITTASGMYEYFSDSTPAAANYDNVYAFPNPVRPDFTGLITIKGLMDNSLIKIADASGNVIKQIKSIGGMATWDGCGDNGDRVKTGVYYVIASQSTTSGSESAVTKIVIIR